MKAFFLALSFALALGAPIAAAGQAPPLALSNQALAEQRGGLQTPSGMTFGFGATVRTYIDGQVALETKLTWTDQGAQTQNLGTSSAGAALPGSWTDVLPGVGGGATTVTHTLAADNISSLVINTANNRTIRQQTDVTLVLPQLADLQRQAAGDRIAANLQTAVGLALRTGK